MDDRSSTGIGPATSLGRRGRSAAAWNLNATDRLTLVVLVILAYLLATHGGSRRILLLIALLAGAVTGLAFLGSRSRLACIAHRFSLIAWIPCTFNLAGPVIVASNSSRWDGLFRTLDAHWFGGLGDAWRGALGRPFWLTDFASLAYGAFYFLPIIVAVAIYRRRPEQFDTYAFVVELAFYLPIAGYLLLPASGPRVPLEHEAQVLGGGAISAGLRAFLHATERNTLDAFPSGHAAVSLVVLGCGWRLLPRWRPPLVLMVIAILFATVYLSIHYIVDLLAGAAVAGATPLLLPLLGRLCGLLTEPALVPRRT